MQAWRARRCRRMWPERSTARRRSFQDTQKGLVTLFIIAIFVIYIVLGILYESFIHPLTILSGIPFAAFGALLALIDHAHRTDRVRLGRHHHARGAGQEERDHDGGFRDARRRRTGKRPFEAITEACSVRFRPITMTTMAALVGTLPIALGAGAGAESAAAAGHRGGGRAGVLAGGDAVRNAGDLYLLRRVEGEVREEGRKPEAGGRSPAAGRGDGAFAGGARAGVGMGRAKAGDGPALTAD